MADGKPGKVNLDEKLRQFSERWSPRVVGELNGQQVKLAKLEGEFLWHRHEREDELFLVLRGQLSIQLRDRTVELDPGESMAERTHGSIVPTLRYRDAAAAIDWLCEAFGFARHRVVPGEGGRIAHAQLVYGNGMIMLGSAGDDDFDRLQKPPADVGGVGTQSPYIIVADADAHYEQARAAGARIVHEIRDEDYGGRGYSCLDPEGHLWNFGTYDPWGPAE